MRLSLAGFALLFAIGACGGEARKLGEVDVPGGAGGIDGVGFSGAPTGSGGTAAGFGGTVASGGVSVTASGGGDPITIPPATGGTSTLDGGQIPITEQQRSSLAATACANINLKHPESMPTNLELLVDTSASMAEIKVGAVGLSDWELTRDALLSALDALPSTTRVGLVLFPPPEVVGGNAGASCGVLSESVASAELGEAGSAQRTLLSQRLQAVVPRGSTPLFDAYQFAVDEVRTALGDRMVLLATDGAPTVPVCGIGGGEGGAVDAAPIVELVQSAYVSHGVRTMVVGSPGSSDENRTWLSSAAVNGGTAEAGCDVHAARCHFDLASKADLASQLTAKRGTSDYNCTFQITEAPGQVLDFSQVSVVLNDSAGSLLLLEDAVGDCSAGFQLATNHSITLCPDSCALALHADVQILVACITTAR
jgi:hypothetical protein